MSAPLRAVQKRPTREELETVIRAEGGNVTAIAERLGATRQSTYAWIAQAGLRDLVGIRPPEANAAGRVSATVKIDGDTWKRIRVLAVEQDRTASQVVQEALGAYLAAVRE
jgi:transposase-like protein